MGMVLEAMEPNQIPEGEEEQGAWAAACRGLVGAASREVGGLLGASVTWKPKKKMPWG
jgi:hypothetical protein